jgi:tryptophanyl-tRNA synthetase
MENKVIDQVLKDGAQKANYIANKKIRKVYKKVGFTI